MTVSKRIRADWSRLRRTSWQDYGVRFALGGTITAVAGILAQTYGPVVGGLFLAFPAILPASATLIEQHAGKKEAQADTVGAAVGSVALLAFGAVVWVLGARAAPWLVLTSALLAWLAVAAGLWAVLRRRRAFRRASAGR